jgi:hypothetical protein
MKKNRIKQVSNMIHSRARACLLLGMVALCTVSAANAATGTIKILGIDAGDLAGDLASGTGWTWTAATSTLTLGTGYNGAENIWIDCAPGDDININYTDNITINSGASYAILCNGNLHLSSLADTLTLITTNNIALQAVGNLTIGGGATVIATGSPAIRSDATLTISGAARVTAVGNTDNAIKGSLVHISTSDTVSLSNGSGNTIDAGTTFLDGSTTLKGTITASGDIVVSAGAAPTIHSAATLTIASGKSLEINTGASIQNNGIIANEGTITNNGDFFTALILNSNTGAITGDLHISSGSAAINAITGNLYVDGGIATVGAITGDLHADNGATVYISATPTGVTGDVYTEGTGTAVTFAGNVGGNVHANGGTTIVGGNIGGDLDLLAGTVTAGSILGNLAIANGATLRIPSGATFAVSAGKTLENHGTIDIIGTATFTNNGAITNDSIINIANTATFLNDAGNITNNLTGDITNNNTAAGSFTNDGTISNSGFIRSDPGAVAGTGSYTGDPIIALGAVPPTAPYAVTAARGNAEATITFTAPANKGSSAITVYTVTSTPGGFTATGANSPITVTGLTNGTAYTFTVTATNGEGASPDSPPSNSVIPASTVTITFDAYGGIPDTLHVPIAPNTATGTQMPPDPVLYGYNFSGWYFGFEGTGDAFTATTIVATDTIVHAHWTSLTPTITVAGVPRNVTAVAGNEQATVSFQAPLNDGGNTITGYIVYSLPDSLTTTGLDTTLVVTGLTNGTQYTFTVRAINGIGTGAASAFSNSVTPLITVPDAPINVTATAGNGQATVTFLPPPNGGGSEIIGYTVYSQPDSLTVTGAATTLVVPDLTNGTSYVFTVRATNSVGTSAASAASNSVIPDNTFTLTIPAVEGLKTEPAAGTYSYDFDEVIPVLFEPLPGYDLSNVVIYVNDEITVPSAYADGKLFLSFTMTGNVTIRVEGVRTGTDPIPDGQRIYAIPGAIRLELAQAEKVRIYTLSGALHTQATLSAGVTTVALPTGIYLVRVHGETYKVGVF